MLGRRSHTCLVYVYHQMTVSSFFDVIVWVASVYLQSINLHTAFLQ